MFYGNIEKYRISRELLECPEGTKILDFGAGSGSDWPEFMRSRPDLQLFFFEPDAQSARKLAEKVRGTSGTILTTMADCPTDVDRIVSFSVFEHVYDRRAYLRDCARVLADDGRLYLNYDDGHFRFDLAINQGVSWRYNLRQLRERAINAMRPAAAQFGLVRYYQQRVGDIEVAAHAEAAGLQIQSSRYANLTSMKALAKAVEPGSLDTFHESWLRLEDELNNAVAFTPGMSMEHRDARWREMPTCTLTLGKR